MSTENIAFESTDTFTDDPITPEVLTPEQEFEKSFAETTDIQQAKEPETAPETPIRRIYEDMSDDELKDIFSKARQVDELNERLTKTHKDAFGRIGGLEKTVKELKEAKSNPQQVNISKDLFKNLAEYLGDDSEIPDALAKDLSALQLGIPMTPNLDIDAKLAAQEAKFAERQKELMDKLLETKRDLEVRLLSFQHPDWEEINTVPEKTQEFIDWQMTLKPQDRQVLESASNNWDAKTLSSALTKFKDWKAKKTEFENSKNNRLAGNVPPTNGNSYSRPTKTNDAYESAFNAALRSN